MITVIKPGLLTSVQDLGRPGYQQYGIVVGGALDGFSTRVANLILGNADSAAVLEMAQTGPELRFEQETLVAWCGADFDARIGVESLPRDRPVRIAAGETLSFGFARTGLRAWLAVAGGIDVPLVMGSRSTYRRGGNWGISRTAAGGGRHIGDWCIQVSVRSICWPLCERPDGVRPAGPCGPKHSAERLSTARCERCRGRSGTGLRQRHSGLFSPPNGEQPRRLTGWECG